MTIADSLRRWRILYPLLGVALCVSCSSAAVVVSPGPIRSNTPVSVDPRAVAEAVPLIFAGVRVYHDVLQREARHAAELRRKGIAEIPPSEGTRYVIDTAGLGDLVFNDRGELYIDRRFVTKEDMKTIKAIERWIARWFPRQTRKRKVPREHAGGAGLPVFCGFEDDRYQQHDRLIARLVAEFNADKARWCGGTPAQAARIPNLTAALVKAHMVEETGGNDARSLSAWAMDPLQVNVPGDWGAEKVLVGLARSAKRNSGTLEGNVRAALMYLSRKGFSSAARPAAERPKGYFDGWKEALRRYNGRRDRTDTNRYYSAEYADKILERASNPDLFVPIEIKLATGKGADGPE